jgi:hypothetical protein
MLTTPVMSNVPKGPALNVTGDAVCRGPVVGGVGSGCGSAGDCVVEGSCALIGMLAGGRHAIAADMNKRLNGYLPIVTRIGVSQAKACATTLPNPTPRNVET